MGKDDKSSNTSGFRWEKVRRRGKRAVAWTLGTLLKVGGVLTIIAGLLAIALANMDGTPVHDLIWGTVTICSGILMLYFGSKISKIAKRT